MPVINIQQKSRPGAVAVFMAVCLIALLSVLALTIDGGSLYEKRRQTQASADAAAMAAAIDLYQNYWTNEGDAPENTASDSAFGTAAANGFPKDGSQADVTVNIPPKSGRYEGLTGYAEVILEFKQNRSFANI